MIETWQYFEYICILNNWSSIFEQMTLPRYIGRWNYLELMLEKCFDSIGLALYYCDGLWNELFEVHLGISCALHTCTCWVLWIGAKHPQFLLWGSDAICSLYFIFLCGIFSLLNFLCGCSIIYNQVLDDGGMIGDWFASLQLIFLFLSFLQEIAIWQ